MRVFCYDNSIGERQDPYMMYTKSSSGFSTALD